MKPHVYIFRGAPASGKGTLLPEFCKLLPQPIALIEQDNFRWGFHLIGRNVPDITDDEHAFAHRNTVIVYEQYLRNGNYTIVLEGLFTWDAPVSSQGSTRELVELARRYNFPCTSIVLMAAKETLLQRNAQRQHSVPREEFEVLYRNIYTTIDASEVVVDSTTRSVEDTVRYLKDCVL